MIFRAVILIVLSALIVSPAMAEQPVPQQPAPKKKPAAPAPKVEHPQPTGKFDDWFIATYQEAGQPVCYALSYAQSSTPAVAGRGKVFMTVTQRLSGRDIVAIDAGYAFAPNATVNVQADQNGLDFYTHQRAAFARDGHAAVTAFRAAARAISRSPGPHEITVTDTFSLKGFSAAYEAISKACPPK